MDVLIKYHSEKMRGTIDLDYLVSRVTRAGEGEVVVDLVLMSEAERRAAEEVSGPLTLIRKRALIFLDGVRSEELENEIHRCP